MKSVQCRETKVKVFSLVVLLPPNATKLDKLKVHCYPSLSHIPQFLR
jgi:hypothetical protein